MKDKLINFFVGVSFSLLVGYGMFQESGKFANISSFFAVLQILASFYIIFFYDLKKRRIDLKEKLNKRFTYQDEITTAALGVSAASVGWYLTATAYIFSLFVLLDARKS